MSDATPTLPPADPESQATLPPTLADGTPPADAPTADAVRYRVLRFHARGGLGEVFVALDTEVGREVALKEIQDELRRRPRQPGRFLREAEVTGRLEHPASCRSTAWAAMPTAGPTTPCVSSAAKRWTPPRRFHEADRPGRDPGERALAFGNC